MLNFAARNRKEIFRDPLSIILGLAIPVIFLFIFTSIEKNAPLDTFKVNNFAPGIIVFGFAFLTMFSALLIAKDKQTAFLTRLFASPLKGIDYVVGYCLPMIFLAVLQTVICYLVAMAVGLSAEWTNILMSMLVLLPIAGTSIFIGLLLGSIFTDKQIQGIGTLYIFLVSFLSGAWVDLALLGDTFEKVAQFLPFVHAIQLSQNMLTGDYSAFHEHFWWVIGYALITLAIAILAFVKIYKK